MRLFVLALAFSLSSLAWSQTPAPAWTTAAAIQPAMTAGETKAFMKKLAQFVLYLEGKLDWEMANQ